MHTINHHPRLSFSRKEKAYLFGTWKANVTLISVRLVRPEPGALPSKIIQALTDQAQKLTLVSRASSRNILGECIHGVYLQVSYDKLLPMNTRQRQSKPPLKLCAPLGYRIKGIKLPNVLRSLFAARISTDVQSRLFWRSTD